MIGADEALHVGLAVGAGGSVEDLRVNGGEVVMGVWEELAAEFGARLDRDDGSGGVRIGFVAGEAVDEGVGGFEGSEHVVEGAVLQHENNDVFESLDSG